VAIHSGGKRARYSGREDSAGLVAAWFATKVKRALTHDEQKHCALRLELR